MKSTRGVVAVLAYIVGAAVCVLLVAAVHEYNKLTAPAKPQKQVDAVAVVVDATAAQAKQADAQAQAVAAAVAQVQTDHAAVEAKHVAVDSAASGFLDGASTALAADPAPTAAEQAAAMLLESATTTLGQPLTPAQHAVWVKTVGALIAKNAEAEKALTEQTAAAVALRASLTAEQAHSAASDAHAGSLANQLENETAVLTVTAADAATKTAAVKAWADDNETLWTRFKALGGLAVCLALIALLIACKLLGVQATCKDAVALVEHVKTLAAEGVHDIPAIESKIAEWWGDAKKDLAKFNVVKNSLRQ